MYVIFMHACSLRTGDLESEPHPKNFSFYVLSTASGHLKSNKVICQYTLKTRLMSQTTLQPDLKTQPKHRITITRDIPPQARKVHRSLSLHVRYRATPI